jgi:hypothetical protein
MLYLALPCLASFPCILLTVLLQVVNHGVEEDVVQGFREAAAEFFAMPQEAKHKYYSEDPSKPSRVVSGSLTSNNNANDIRFWHDCLHLRCYPVDKLVHQWPSEPEMFRYSLCPQICCILPPYE